MSRRTVVAAIGVAAVAVGGALSGVFAVGGSHSTPSVSLPANSHREHHPREMRMARGWSFSELNNSNDPTFNQLLGINNRGQIAGYFGSGAKGHPNKGYMLNLDIPISSSSRPAGRCLTLGIERPARVLTRWAAAGQREVRS